MNIESSIFREYDIRGTYPEQINESSIKSIAFAIAKRCKKDNISTLVVGRDGRMSGPALLEAFCEGLIESGINVDNIGLVTSPLLYFAAKKSASKSGIMITGSHNPKNYNGIKMVINDSPISGTEIYTLINHEKNTNLEKGEVQYSDIKPIYLEEVCNNISINNPEKIKVVLDCGNGAAGCIAPDLFKKLGLDVIELYSEVDGDFPNHHPDPGKLENLHDLINEVKDNNADIGFAFDGDGDRVGLVTNNGDSVFPDKLMMLFSKDILSKDKGSIVFDVKCSNQLENIIRENGGDPIMSPTGHFHIKKSIKKHNSLLGGEMSGHIFFNDKWYGFDDGIYAAARLLEILSEFKDPSKILKDLPKSFSTPELNIKLKEGEQHTIISKLQETAEFPEAIDIIKIDGLRIEYTDGFGLMRASNTTPVIVLRFEAESKEKLKSIQDEFKLKLIEYIPPENIPF